ncbi:MAG: DUF6398 domain-containing protein [Planctomycetota bacterium]|jgi:hypothetical protein
MEKGEAASADDFLAALTAKVPKRNRAWFKEIVGLVDAFADAHLNAEYKEVLREMAAALSRKRSLALKGKSAAWAAGIVHALGTVNFLFDPSQSPHVPLRQIAAHFGVSVGHMSGRSRIIRRALHTSQLDPAWCLPSKLDDNPLVWMIEVDGLVLDMRYAPRALQFAAYHMGLIPYVPPAGDAATEQD